jgi:hypothetical protein
MLRSAHQGEQSVAIDYRCRCLGAVGVDFDDLEALARSDLFT